MNNKKIQIKGLRKSFGSMVVLDDLYLDIDEQFLLYIQELTRDAQLNLIFHRKRNFL